MIYKLVIIGSGPAGLTAGIYAGRALLNPLIIEGKDPGGQLIKTTYVENWPGEKKILGSQLINNIREQAKESGCSFLSDRVSKVDFSKKPFTLFTEKGNEIKSDSVIISTGASPKKLNIPGEQDYLAKGVSTCAICDGTFFKDKKVIIVGGGNTAMESASFLNKFTDQITIVHILDKLTANPASQKMVLKNPNIKIIYNSTITKIEGDGKKVTAIEIFNKKNQSKTQIDIDGVFLAIGTQPNTDIFKGQLELNSYGFITLKNHVKTSIDGVFAAGDVADYIYRQAITSAGTGCMAAIDAEKYLEQI